MIKKIKTNHQRKVGSSNSTGASRALISLGLFLLLSISGGY
jgi:hypothetical protein